MVLKITKSVCKLLRLNLTDLLRLEYSILCCPITFNEIHPLHKVNLRSLTSDRSTPYKWG